MTAALTEAPHRMAETTVAVDPQNDSHLVAAADPYRGQARIVLTESMDGGVNWKTPIEVLPPGFVKSYDPNLSFDNAGNIVIVAGASGQGAPHCQPGSEIFGVRIRSSNLEYFTMQPARDGVYVDRPALAVDRRTSRIFVTWTESSGKGSECMGSPAASRTMLARSTSGVQFGAALTLPSSGLVAPFGSSITARSGDLSVAVGERDPGKIERVVVVRSQDEGKTFSTPQILSEGPPVPSYINGLGGFVTAVPSIASAPGRLAVAWASSKPGGSRIRIQAFAAGGWSEISPPEDGAPFGLFPNIAFDGEGRLWSLNASYGDEQVRFLLRSFLRSWSEPVEVGRGAAGGYIELGQFLGISAGQNSLVTAVPIDSDVSSRLLVSVNQIPAVSTSPSPSASSQGQVEAKVPPSSKSASQRRGVSTAVILFGGLGAAGLSLVGLWIRRASRAAGRRSVRPPKR